MSSRRGHSPASRLKPLLPGLFRAGLLQLRGRHAVLALERGAETAGVRIAGDGGGDVHRYALTLQRLAGAFQPQLALVVGDALAVAVLEAALQVDRVGAELARHLGDAQCIGLAAFQPLLQA